MLTTIRRHAAAILPTLTAVAPQPSGIMPSEMLAFCALCRDQGVEVVIESGRKHGYSTEVLARCLWACEINSIEQSPIAASDARLDFDNLYLVTGSGLSLVPQVTPHRRPSAVLLDGPKGHAAIALLNQVADRIAFGAVHDLCAGNEARLACAGRDVWYTDDPEFVAEFGHLDEFWWRNGGYSSRAEMVRESFCFGFFKGKQWR